MVSALRAVNSANFKIGIAYTRASLVRLESELVGRLDISSQQTDSEATSVYARTLSEDFKYSSYLSNLSNARYVVAPSMANAVQPRSD